jgi:hypothetical protein
MTNVRERSKRLASTPILELRSNFLVSAVSADERHTLAAASRHKIVVRGTDR